MRRRRFTVTFESRAKRVILAYTAADARMHYERKGVAVSKVVLGDYRATGGGGWRVDHAALRDACDLLGLKLPVSIRFNSRVGKTHGNYTFRRGGHDIMLKAYRTAEQASETLWHELTHALQVERGGGTYQAFEKMVEDEKGVYQNAPSEIEAREMSATMADIPLVVPR